MDLTISAITYFRAFYLTMRRDLSLVTASQPTAPSIGRSKGTYNFFWKSGGLSSAAANPQLLPFLSCHSLHVHGGVHFVLYTETEFKKIFHGCQYNATCCNRYSIIYDSINKKEQCKIIEKFKGTLY